MTAFCVFVKNGADIITASCNFIPFLTVRIVFLCHQHNRTPRLTGTLQHRKAVFILFGPYRLIPVQNKLEVLIINLLYSVYSSSVMNKQK